MLDPKRLEQTLRDAFPDARIEIRDLTGTSDHYDVTIQSERFIGVAPLARHRLVFGALKEPMKGDIHALALHTYTPEEWAKRA